MPRWLAHLVVVVGWLATPALAWGASYLGMWLGALLGARFASPPAMLGVAALVTAIAGLSTLWVWVRFVRRVAHTHDFFPIGHTRSREDWRANSDCDDAASREPRAVAKRVARSCQRYRHDGTPGRDGRLKGAKLEWPQTRSRGESSLRKDENRFTVTQRFFNFLRLLQPGSGIFPIEREMPEFAEKRAEKRHRTHFTLGDEMIVHAKSGHQDEYIRVAGVICDKHARRISLRGRGLYAPSPSRWLWHIGDLEPT